MLDETTLASDLCASDVKLTQTEKYNQINFIHLNGT